MQDKLYITIEIRQWWIDWWRDDECYFCALVEINGNKLEYIERKLNNT